MKFVAVFTLVASFAATAAPLRAVVKALSNLGDQTRVGRMKPAINSWESHLRYEGDAILNLYHEADNVSLRVGVRDDGINILCFRPYLPHHLGTVRPVIREYTRKLEKALQDVGVNPTDFRFGTGDDLWVGVYGTFVRASIKKEAVAEMDVADMLYIIRQTAR